MSLLLNLCKLVKRNFQRSFIKKENELVFYIYKIYKADFCTLNKYLLVLT